jgi:uncharacterized protein YndB with AHSA1/START domain
MTEVTITREFLAAPERVWDAFTIADQLGSWFWPASWSTDCELDLRIGGRFRIVSGATELAVSGEYLEIEPRTLLAHTWRWDGDAIETHVRLNFEPTDAGMTLTLLHNGFESDAMRVDHHDGWNDCLDRLPVFLAGSE